MGDLIDPTRAPFVDNMHIDGNIIFGSTRSHAEERKMSNLDPDPGKDGGQVYLFKLGIDANGDYDGSTFFCSKVYEDGKEDS